MTLFGAVIRSPHLWKDPDVFRPERFSETNSNPDFGGAWAGYRPEAQGSSLYPNEVAADFAFIPFGGGARKCVGDQFALMEATVALTMLLRSGTATSLNICCRLLFSHYLIMSGTLTSLLMGASSRLMKGIGLSSSILLQCINVVHTRASVSGKQLLLEGKICKEL